jgi:hypothetical protein
MPTVTVAGWPERPVVTILIGEVSRRALSARLSDEGLDWICGRHDVLAYRAVDAWACLVLPEAATATDGASFTNI